ncbi:vWA domain-containing protein [Marinicrinis sediminis]|uniref:VWA domain-containing protein n=1 Tax=Marinicrinis sediminis TaxID=1652465 RepID=A0ABW5REP3_9BACL
MVFAFREEVDVTSQLQLLDLSKGLSRITQMEVTSDSVASLQLDKGVCMYSSFWDGMDKQAQFAGRKSDIHVQSYGIRWFSQDEGIAFFEELLARQPNWPHKLTHQIFACTEQQRVMHRSLLERPGMSGTWMKRLQMYGQFYLRQAPNWLRQKQTTELLWLYLFMELLEAYVRVWHQTPPGETLNPLRISAYANPIRHASPPNSLLSLHSKWRSDGTRDQVAAELLSYEPLIRTWSKHAHDAIQMETTMELALFVKSCLALLPREDIKDLKTQHFKLQQKGKESVHLQAQTVTEPVKTSSKGSSLPDTDQDDQHADKPSPSVHEASVTEEQRTDKGKLEADKQPELEKDDGDAPERADLPMWHRETEQTKDSSLQMRIERGTSLALSASEARESNQQSSSMNIMHNRYQTGGRDKLDTQKHLHPGQGSLQNWIEKLHQHVRPVHIRPSQRNPKWNQVSQDERLQQYEEWKTELSGPIRRLEQQLKLLLLKQHHAPSGKKRSGRHIHSLVDAVTEPLPRLFQHRQAPSRSLHAAFSILIDCSASMANKMERTKKGAVLIHEGLKRLAVPHEMIGFWEEGAGLHSELPNMFYHAVEWEHSLEPDAGLSILDLEPQQDNRDGYIIRQASAELMKRQEEQKIMLVFCDGQPSAEDYFEDGVLDTYAAVYEARKRGIEVIGIFLSDQEMPEEEQNALQHIYGSYRVTVPDMDHLIDQLTPLLKKILFQALKSQS